VHTAVVAACCNFCYVCVLVCVRVRALRMFPQLLQVPQRVRRGHVEALVSLTASA
jgi:hypothetical protein